MSESNGPRRHQAEERREQILDAALRVFSEKGFAGASIRDIAREVGVTEGLLYHYFESKDDLMQACWRERSWRAHLEQVLTEVDSLPLLEALRALAVDFLSTLYEHAPAVRLHVMEQLREPDLAEQQIHRVENDQGIIARYLRARQQRGEIRPDADVEAAAGLFMGSAFSLFLLWNAAGPEIWQERVQRHIDDAVEIIANGLICQPAV